MLAPGCLSPEREHRVLTFFLDGVPPLEVATELPPPGELQAFADLTASAPLVTAPKPRAPQFYLHVPYAEKECEECHEDRFSNRLVAQEEELCWECHDKEDFPGEVVHGPMAAGDCGGCHDPHKSRYPYMLFDSGPALCMQCHDQETFPGSEEHRVDQGEDCVGCHNPHAAGRAYLLERDASPL
jgi:predicted CXXCH cytochrome family protein